MSMRNSEGHPDPTAWQALRNISGHPFMPVIYISSPYSGDVEANVRNARRYCRFAVEQGYIPIAPHLLLPQFMLDSNPDEHDLAIFMDLVLLSKCAELWVFGDWVSSGMETEISKAKRKRMTIRLFTPECREVTECTKQS
ncbi:MAG: DUF4406 domain-containing protein [Lachnospiraceae bacterium]|nr:DUF4406 domain-containing protein [Lachnospiraceae bacterium]